MEVLLRRSTMADGGTWFFFNHILIAKAGDAVPSIWAESWEASRLRGISGQPKAWRWVVWPTVFSHFVRGGRATSIVAQDGAC